MDRGEAWDNKEAKGIDWDGMEEESVDVGGRDGLREFSLE